MLMIDLGRLVFPRSSGFPGTDSNARRPSRGNQAGVALTPRQRPSPAEPSPTESSPTRANPNESSSLTGAQLRLVFPPRYEDYTYYTFL
jgi:hypothetical protein